MAKTKRRGMVVNGMLLLDKPPGLSSNQALQRAKRLMDAQKAGHTGSLDPIATGLLPLCFGEATRISEVFLGADKSYRVNIKLGVATDTGDCEGTPQAEHTVNVTEQQLTTALEKFRGTFNQVPPMFSALKQNGTPLYKLAREGISVKREPRKVTVYELQVEKFAGTDLELTLSCSRGFYVRTLASDLGEALGCGGHVQALRRIAVGDFEINNTVTLEQLEALDSPSARQQLLITTEQGLNHLPEINIPDNIAVYLCNGRSVRAPTTETVPGLVRVYSDSGGFLGLGELQADGKVTPKRLFPS